MAWSPEGKTLRVARAEQPEVFGPCGQWQWLRCAQLDLAVGEQESPRERSDSACLRRHRRRRGEAQETLGVPVKVLAAITAGGSIEERGFDPEEPEWAAQVCEQLERIGNPLVLLVGLR